jgi:5-methylcytosine-specific restriction endonuclease McrA
VKVISEEKKREYCERKWGKIKNNPIAHAQYKAARKAKWAAFRAAVSTDPAKQAKMEQRRALNRLWRQRVKQDPLLLQREREKRQARWAAWYAKAKDNAEAQTRKAVQRQADYLRNKAKRNATKQAWSDRNRDRAAIAAQRFAKAHPEKILIWSSRKSANRRAQIELTAISVIDYALLVQSADGKCGICAQALNDGKAIHVDHIIPLAKGGSHTQDNLQLTHARCNLKKGAKLLKAG